MATARGIRNNNPGNIRHGEKWQGLAPEQTDSAFAQFVSMRYGIRALIKLLRTYRSKHGLSTPRGIIGRWAPPSENDTNAYVNAVARALNVSPDAEIPETPVAYETLARAIAAHENGAQQAAVISPSDWAAGVRMGFDLPVDAPAPTPAPVADEIPVRAGPPAPIVDVPPTQPHIEPLATWPFEATDRDIIKREVPTMAVPAVFAALLPSLLPTIVNAIPVLGKIFGSGSEVSNRNIAAAEVVGNIIIQATGAHNLQEATEKIVADPVARQQATEAIGTEWFQLTEAGGGGVEGAREWNDKAAAGDVPFWRLPAMVVTAMLLPMIYFVVYQVMTDVTYTSEIRTMVVSLVVGTTLGAIVGFFLGSSFGSQSKDKTTATAAVVAAKAALTR